MRANAGDVQGTLVSVCALSALSVCVCRLQRGGTKGAALKAGALAHVTSYLPEEDYMESPSTPGAAALSPRAAAHTQRGVDYEFGKAFDRQDADKYFGGMISESTSLRCVRLCTCLTDSLINHERSWVVGLAQTFLAEGRWCSSLSDQRLPIFARSASPQATCTALIFSYIPCFIDFSICTQQHTSNNIEVCIQV